MWLQVAESRRCLNCKVPIEHWVLYGESGRTVAEATFCPICYPDVKGVFDADLARSPEEAVKTSQAWTAIRMPDAA